MGTFLIDYENVKSNAFAGIESLTAEDTIIIFYTNNSNSLSFDLMNKLATSNAHIKYFKVACGGKNALDFQLCSYLGYLIGKGEKNNFYIISKDLGFETMLSFWENKLAEGQKIMRQVSIASILLSEGIIRAVQDEEKEDVEDGIPVPPKPVPVVDEIKDNPEKLKVPPKPVRKTKQEVMPIPKQEDDSTPEQIKDRLNQLLNGKCSDKEIKGIVDILRSVATRQELYRDMIKLFKQQRGRELYRAIRPEYISLTEMVK